MEKIEIVREFLGRTDCAAFLIKLSENGYHQDVCRQLKQMPKNTITYDIAKKNLCDISAEEKFDHQGFYIGSYYTVKYNDEVVEQYMNYSLFN